MQKVASGSVGKLVQTAADGSVTPTEINAADVLTEHQDISGKADKPESATENNLAAFNGSKNPVDSGIPKGDVQTKLTGAVENNFLSVGSDGKMKDSGIRMATDTEVDAMLDEVFGTSNSDG